MTDDAQLLRDYVQSRSEAAFGELVSRHIDLVYSAALRALAGDRHLAEDVTQQVFCDLARKAAQLPAGVVLPGWLHQHASFTASKAVRTECRRRNREQIALAMSVSDEKNSPSQWEEIAPHLDAGLNQLSAADRDAIVLRFLKQQSLEAVGIALGVSEDTAQKRVSRALEKLRAILQRRGIAISAATLASVLAAETVTAAPAGLALSISAAALAGAATLGTTAAITSTMKTFALTKLQLAVAGVVLAVGIATPVTLQHRALQRLRQQNLELARQNQALSLEANALARLQEQNERLARQLAQAQQPTPAKADQKTELLKLRGEVSRLHAAADSAKATPPMAAMFKDPSMKEFMKSTLSATIDKQYSKLLSHLQMPAEQTDALRDLLIKRSLPGADLGLSALSGELDAAKRKELLDQIQAQTDAVTTQIKDLLGEERFAQFQNYEKNLADYTTLTLFEDQLPKSASLTPAQEDQLIKVFTEERGAFKFSYNFPHEKSDPQNLAAIFSEDHLAQYEKEQAQLNQRYLARAQSILVPEQVSNLESYLASQAKMQTATMRMTVQMLAPKPAGN